MLEFLHDYYKDSIEKKRISIAKSFATRRAVDDGLWFAWVHVNRNRWKKHRRYSKRLLDEDWFCHNAIDPTHIIDSSAWREKFLKVTNIILNKIKQSRIENPKVWRQEFMNNVERILKPFKSNEDAWSYIYEFERLGKQIKVERKNKSAHKKLVADIYLELKRMDIQDKLRKMSPNLLLFPELKHDKKKNYNQKTKKSRSYIENKQKFMHAQLALGISGEQINIAGV